MGAHIRAWIALALWMGMIPSARAADFCIEVPAKVKRVRVRVVAILASEEHNRIDRKLRCLARELQKKYPKMTGFTIAEDSCQSIPVNDSHAFPLGVEAKAVVKVLKRNDAKKCVQVTVDPPTVGKITYTATCGKFFPIITRYKEKRTQERLIIAISTQPCNKK